MLFVPTIFMTAVFPVLARMYVTEKDRAFNVARKSFILLLLVGVPIGLGLVVVSNPLVVLLYGPDFAGSGPILALLGIFLILTFQNILIGQYLISIDRQATWTRVMAVGTLITVPLDIVLMPFCQKEFGNGAIGGAISFVMTELGMFVAGMTYMPRGVVGWPTLKISGKILLSGIVMAAVAWQFRNLFIAVPVVIGVIVYVGLVLLLKVVPPEDWALLKEMASHLIDRFRRKRAGLSGVR
jgi:O-antigen/teichoic acid export membrane protein